MRALLLVILLSLWLPSQVCEAALPGRSEELNKLGRGAYDKGDFKLARDFFKQAWAEKPSAHYLFNAAKASIRLTEPEVAIYFYDQFLMINPASDDAQVVIDDLERLRKELDDRGLVKVEFHSDPAGGLVNIDGEVHPEIQRTPQERWLNPGDYKVMVLLDGWEVIKDVLHVVAPDEALARSYKLKQAPSVGWLELHCSQEGAKILIDQQPLESFEGGAAGVFGGSVKVKASPGVYLVTVSAPGFMTSVEEVQVVSGEVALVELTLISSPQVTPGWSAQEIVGFSATVAGAVGVIAGAGMYAWGSSKMDSGPSNGQAFSDYQDQYNSGRSLAQVGVWTMVGSAAVTLGGGALWYFAKGDDGPPPVSLGPNGIIFSW
jgi:tetratricopeptide (TPR) repeat protein